MSTQELSTITSMATTETKYQLDQTYKAIPGTIVKVLLEFPDYENGLSAVIELDDVMTLSYSVYRVKVPVVTLGQNSVTGYGLGVKTVAGSMIRSVFMTDRLSEFQTKCYLINQEDIKSRLENLDDNFASGVPLKDQLSFMKDDLAYFNIHMVSIAEELKDDGYFGTPPATVVIVSGSQPGVAGMTNRITIRTIQ